MMLKKVKVMIRNSEKEYGYKEGMKRPWRIRYYFLRRCPHSKRMTFWPAKCDGHVATEKRAIELAKKWLANPILTLKYEP